MPPLRKKKAAVPSTVCRVCMSEGGVFLELFGSEIQSVSYAEDISTCLSYEVKEGDGLPSKICIKCVGVISDCRPFVDKSLEVHAKRQKNSEATQDSGTSCYYCLGSDNILFPVPEKTIIKTRDCFDFEVTRDHKVCIRCQFLLESLHELKLKAFEVLKVFNSNSVLDKEKPSPKKEESIADIVVQLTDRFVTDKPKKKSASSAVSKTKIVPETESKMETKMFRLKIVDIGRVIGLDFLKGTISVSEYWKRLGTPCQVSSSQMQKAAPKVSKRYNSQKSTKLNVKELPLSEMKGEQSGDKNNQKSFSQKKSRKVSPIEGSEEIHAKPDDKPTLIEDATNARRKRTRGLSDPECSTTSKKPRTASESEKSEKSIGFSPCPKSKKSSQAAEKKDSKLESDNEQSVTSTGKLSESSPVMKKGVKGSKKSKYKQDKAETETLSNIPEKQAQPLIVRPVASTDKDNGGAVENEFETESGKRRKRNSNFTKYFQDYEDSSKGSRKKRKLQEADDGVFPRSSGRKKSRALSDDDSGLDDPTGGDTVVVVQPDFLKDLDELLKFTPRATFKPFICSVCHEGYVSTVKGKLHKLIVHDPHSSLVLKLTRCDDGSEVMDVILNDSKSSRVLTDKNNVTTSDSETDSRERKTREPIYDDDDDLFNSDRNKDSTLLKPKSNEEIFDGLFGSSSDKATNVNTVVGCKQKPDEKETEQEYVANDKVMNVEETIVEKEDEELEDGNCARKESDNGNDEKKESDDGNDEKKKSDDGNDEKKKYDDGNDEKKKSGDGNDEKKESVDANDEKKEPVDANDEKKESDDGNDEKKESDDGNDEKEESVDGNDEKKESDDGNDEKEESVDGNYEKKESDDGNDEKKESVDGNDEKKESQNGNNEGRDSGLGEGHEECTEDEKEELAEKTTERTDIEKSGKLKEDTHDKEMEVDKPDDETNDKEMEVNKSKEERNGKETEVDELRKETNDESTDNPGDKEQNTKSNNKTQRDDSVVEEVFGNDDKSPVSIEGDKEAHENKGSEADVESNGSGEADENSDDDAGKELLERSYDKVDSTTGSLKDVENVKDRLSNADFSTQFPGAEGIPVGDA